MADAVVVTGRLDLPDFMRHLCAADVVLALRFPSHGEMSGAPKCSAWTYGPVAPVERRLVAMFSAFQNVLPGALEELELRAVLEALLDSAPLRHDLSRAARDHVRRRHDLPATVGALMAFLGRVIEGKDRALAALADARAREGTLLAHALEEVRWAARDLGLGQAPPAVGAALHDLFGGTP